MKKIISSIVALVFSSFVVQAQSDTMYVMQTGGNVIKIAVATVDSVIFYKPNTQQSGAVIDKDGNTYKTATIGTQVWMTENLKTSKYNDGTAIPLVTDNSAWTVLTTPAYCWYNNDVTNKPTYGALYNWYSINTTKLCPVGWHVPTDAEWTTLITYLGGSTVAGGKMKEVGTSHWVTPNTGATNSSGFTAVPGGHRTVNDGNFAGLGTYNYYWSSTESTANNAWYRTLYNYNANSTQSDIKKNDGFSVRCMKD